MLTGGTPLWLDLVFLLAALIAAFEGGRWLGSRLLGHAADPLDGEEADRSGGDNHALSGVFGLLALLMAFSFGMALDRFEQRRALVVAEANALSTLDSRVALLPAEDAYFVRVMLADYGRQRLQFGTAVSDSASYLASERGERIHTALGEAIYASLARSPAGPHGPAVLDPYNEVGDLAAERRAAREGHLPPTVLALLAVFCVAGAAMLGYSRAGSRIVHRPAAFLFLGLLAVAYIAVLDIDRPRDGSITVPQAPMERQVAALVARAAAATEPPPP